MTNKCEDKSDVPLFDSAIIEKLDFTESPAVKFNNNLPPGLVLRPLQREDGGRGYLKVLQHLTVVGKVTPEQFYARFDSMKSCPETYYIIVIVDESQDRVVAAGSLIREWKFIHSCGCRARIEDIVVDKEHRGKQLGKIIVETLRLIGQQQLGTYKISLECNGKLVPYYGQFGFNLEDDQNYLVQRFKL